jgi:hypothetical protein
MGENHHKPGLIWNLDIPSGNLKSPTDTSVLPSLSAPLNIPSSSHLGKTMRLQGEREEDFVSLYNDSFTTCL